MSLDPRQAEAAFRLPDHLTLFITPPGKVIEADRGVYVVEVGGFHPMYIEFKDFVLAVEAPAAHPALESTPADSRQGSSSIAEPFIQARFRYDEAYRAHT